MKNVFLTHHLPFIQRACAVSCQREVLLYVALAATSPCIPRCIHDIIDRRCCVQHWPPALAVTSSHIEKVFLWHSWQRGCVWHCATTSPHFWKLCVALSWMLCIDRSVVVLPPLASGRWHWCGHCMLMRGVVLYRTDCHALNKVIPCRSSWPTHDRPDYQVSISLHSLTYLCTM